MATTDRITPARAAELFAYDPDTGILRWKVRAARCVQVGDIAGALKQDGYICVSVNRMEYRAHHLAWALSYGEWAPMIDHINGIKNDNRISNLRLTDVAHNTQNQRRAHKSNLSSGILGVHFLKRTGRWRATICTDGKNRYLGYFATAEEASAVYVAAKRLLHPGNTL